MPFYKALETWFHIEFSRGLRGLRAGLGCEGSTVHGLGVGEKEVLGC